MGKELKVPLADQALVVLKEAHKHTGELEYVFMLTIGIGKNKPIGENATTNTIRRMIDPRTENAFGTGFVTSHGLRHTTSTMLNELEYPADVINGFHSFRSLLGSENSKTSVFSAQDFDKNYRPSTQKNNGNVPNALAPYQTPYARYSIPC